MGRRQTLRIIAQFNMRIFSDFSGAIKNIDAQKNLIRFLLDLKLM